MRKCLFCGKNNNLTKEHVIPQWLQKEQNIGMDHLLMLNGSNNIVNDVRKFNFNSLTEGRVCQECNNGWMSQLEVENQTHILNLMHMNHPEKEFDYLYSGGNNTFAKWVFKTVILLDSSCGSALKIPLCMLVMLAQICYNCSSYIKGGAAYE